MTTWRPDTTDEKQARIIDIKGSEVTVVEGATPITINLDLSRINLSQNQPDNLEDRQ